MNIRDWSSDVCSSDLSIDPNNAIAKKGLSQITTRVNARRNKLMLRVGVIAYVLIVFMVAITAMIIFTP